MRNTTVSGCRNSIFSAGDVGGLTASIVHQSRRILISIFFTKAGLRDDKFLFFVSRGEVLWT